MKTLKTILMAAAIASMPTMSPVLAAGGHGGGHGGHDMSAMSPEMKKKHDAMEAKLNDTSAFGVKGDPKKSISDCAGRSERDHVRSQIRRREGWRDGQVCLGEQGRASA